METDADSETGKHYRRIVSGLMDRYEALTISALARPLSFAGLGRTTLRQYATAIRFCLRRDDPDSLPIFNEEWRSLSMVRRQMEEEQEKPSVSKKPRIENTMLEATIDRIEDGPVGDHLRSLLLATLRFGLRPCEWGSVRWSDPVERKSIVIGNAKYTRSEIKSGPYEGRSWDRGNGKERIINLIGSLEEIEESRRLIDAMMAHERRAPWEDKSVARSLQRAFQKTREALLKEGLISWRQRRLTIYNFRHQFAADAKLALDIHAGEVAALMGHISPKTAVVSYGRRHQGRPGSLLVSPDASSVAEVKIEGRPLELPAQDPSPAKAQDLAQETAPPAPEQAPPAPAAPQKNPVNPFGPSSMEP